MSILFLLAAWPLYALEGDSLLPVRNNDKGQNELIYHPGKDVLVSENQSAIGTEGLSSYLEETETELLARGNNRRALIRLLKIARVKKVAWNARTGVRLFSDLATVSAKLKLYSLAMKCYSKAEQYKRPEAATEDTGILSDSSTYGRLVSELSPGQQKDPPPYTAKSEPVETAGLWKAFEDGKTAGSYALIVHAKQPVPGKRKSFTHINNVGHLFITLIKYNEDNTVVSRSFGFYPHKTNLLSATPLHVRSESVFKDDALHEWDEIAGKFISERRFQRIIELLKRYDHLTYNLNRNNCTDFGLSVAELGGIRILQTLGTWPLGKGNNPANAGQSMLEGKISNVDPEYQESLFVCSNLLP